MVLKLELQHPDQLQGCFEIRMAGRPLSVSDSVRLSGNRELALLPRSLGETLRLLAGDTEL